MSLPGVLLVSPGAIKWTDRDFGLPHLVSLGGYLRKRLPVEVSIVDLGYEGGDLSRLHALVEGLGRLSVIGVSCYSSFDHLRVESLGRHLVERYPDVTLVVGGYQASALPRSLAGEGKPFHHAVVGEGERPLARIVEAVLGGRRLDESVLGPEVVEDPDDLPPYDWSLLDRYLPRMHELGRKFQIYLSRGCPHSCAFCMERSKASRVWRPFSVERALDELRRLARRIELRRCIVNIADPLFGQRTGWRRELLSAIARQGLLPRQYWTLGRVDSMGSEDVELLHRARFAIGVGLESGSIRVLEAMSKTPTPERYLDGIRRFRELAGRQGLTWAANIILGHPGESLESMQETLDYVQELFPPGEPTTGWLSVDPFRLYPGSEIHERMDEVSERLGTTFHDPRWWERISDRPLRAELVDPSRELSFEQRLDFMHAHFARIVSGIRRSFRYTGRSIDAVYERSLREQEELLAQARLARTKAAVARVRGAGTAGASVGPLPVPVGLHAADRGLAAREEALAMLFERGILQSEELMAAIQRVDVEAFLPSGLTVRQYCLGDGRDRASRPDSPLPFAFYSRALTALEPASGDGLIEIGIVDGYGAALARELVGSGGLIRATTMERRRASAIRKRLRKAGYPDVEVEVRDGTDALEEDPRFDRILLGGCVPEIPSGLVDHLSEGGRLVAAVGPRFRAQRLVVLTRHEQGLHMRDLGPVLIAPLCGRRGWIVRPGSPR
jgi:protein-L-isoaspartate O-methyltransferase/radical SAM superfamily enzyme YgiQ (UPF0313 family)